MKTRGWPKMTTAWIAIATVVHDVQLAMAIAAFTGSTVRSSSNHARSNAIRTTRPPSAVLCATAMFDPLALGDGDGDVPSAGGWGGAAGGGDAADAAGGGGARGARRGGGGAGPPGGGGGAAGAAVGGDDGAAAAGDDGAAAAAVVGAGAPWPREGGEIAGGWLVSPAGSPSLGAAGPGSDAGGPRCRARQRETTRARTHDL